MVKAMASLGNSVRGLSPKNKWLLYRACVLPVTMYGAKLWYFEGSRFKGPMKALRTMQAHACQWITGAFCTSPSGVVKTLAGIHPIHLHIHKLVERSHVRLRTLARSHSAQLLIWGDHPMSMANLSLREKTLICSPVTEAWANQDLCTDDGIPFNEFATPGDQIIDRHPDHIVYDIALPPRGKASKVAKFRAARKEALEEFFAVASTSPDWIALVCDVSKPPLTFWRNIHIGTAHLDVLLFLLSIRPTLLFMHMLIT